MKIVVPVVEGFEEIELVVITSLLRKFNVEVDILTIEKKLEISGAHGIKIVADGYFENMKSYEYDGIIITGGNPGATNLSKSKDVIDVIKLFNIEKKIIGAICSGPIVLREADIIYGKNITSYPGFFDIREKINYKSDIVVEHENIITSRSCVTSTEFTIQIARKLGVKEETINKIINDINYTSFKNKVTVGREGTYEKCISLSI